MSWLLPSALMIAGAAAVVIVALHFIARSRPLAESLPTARFIPERPVHARARSIALSDLLLLFVRTAAALAIGAAVAGPVFVARGRVARIVLADDSRAAANVADVRDSAKAYLGAGDRLIVFDSTAKRSTGVTALDSLAAGTARGSLSAGLAAAMSAAIRASSQADSIELVLVSPLADEEVDDATARIRALWPGRIHVVQVRASQLPAQAPRVELSAAPNDAVAAGLSLMGLSGTAASVRVVRGRTAAADSAWARLSGHVLVHWPARDSDTDWPARSVIDAIGGVAFGNATLVARFPRLWVLDGRAIARWADGEPAAVEHAAGAGCIRDVGILIDQASDVALRAPFRRFAAGLLAPCGGNAATRPLPAAAVAALAGQGSLAPTSTMRGVAALPSRWTPWLLAFGALLLLAELALRRSGVARGRPST